MKKKILIVVGGGIAAAALLGCIFGIPQAVLNYKYSISYPKNIPLLRKLLTVQTEITEFIFEYRRF